MPRSTASWYLDLLYMRKPQYTDQSQPRIVQQKKNCNTPIRTVDEELAWRPASREPRPGRKMLKMKQQMPVARGTDGT